MSDDPMRHCLTTVDDDHTCMLPTDHDGPHVPTSDSDILIALDPITKIKITVKEN